VIQQNASASEEMASTAEELNSQADQLQEIISFFRIDSHLAAYGGVSKSVSKARPKAKLQIGPGRKPKTAKKVAGSDINGKGVEFDMDGDTDGLDKEFERY